MKEKIIIFVVGLLLGAIISTGSIYIYTVANNSNNNQGMQMKGGTPPSMPGMSGGQDGQMPQMPTNDTTESNN